MRLSGFSRNSGLVRFLGGFVRAYLMRRSISRTTEEEEQTITELGRRAWDLRGNLPSTEEVPSRFDELDADVATRTKRLEAAEEEYYFQMDEKSSGRKGLGEEMFRLKDEIEDLNLARATAFHELGQKVDRNRFHDAVLVQYYGRLDRLRRDGMAALEKLRALRRDRLRCLPRLAVELLIVGGLVGLGVHWYLRAATRWEPVFPPDNFDNPAIVRGVWHIMKLKGIGEVRVEGKQLHLIGLTSRRFHYSYRFFPQLQEKFRLSATLTEVSGDEPFGLIFYWRSPKQFFAYEIRRGGEYRLARYTKQGWQALTDWGKSEHLLASTKPNRLAVESRPGKVDLFANGRRLRTVDLTPGMGPQFGKIGVFLRGGGSHVAADDVSVTAPKE